MNTYKEFTISRNENLFFVCHPRGGGDPVSYFNFKIGDFTLDSRVRGNDASSDVMKMLNKIINSLISPNP